MDEKSKELRIETWNVNGYSLVIHIKVISLLKNLDILFLTETKRKKETLLSYEFPKEFEVIINAHSPAQYHGVLMIFRKSLFKKEVKINLKIPSRKDSKMDDATIGRIICIDIEEKGKNIRILGSYTPNSGIRGLLNLDYRVNIWDPALFQLLNDFRKEISVIFLGDLNVSPENIDVSNPSLMKNCAGFTSEERSNYSKFLSEGWIDSFRIFHPKEQGYTWIGNNYRKNHGMRLDHIIISPDLLDFLVSTSIHPEVLLSDHIPFSATFKI